MKKNWREVKKDMKKTAIIVISIVAVSMMLMAIAPALAKPRTITVVVKDSVTGRALDGIRVYATATGTTGTVRLPGAPDSYATTVRGKVTLALPDDGNDYQVCYVYVWIPQGAWSSVYGGPLSRQDSLRLVVSYVS